MAKKQSPKISAKLLIASYNLYRTIKKDSEGEIISINAQGIHLDSIETLLKYCPAEEIKILPRLNKEKWQYNGCVIIDEVSFYCLMTTKEAKKLASQQNK